MLPNPGAAAPTTIRAVALGLVAALGISAAAFDGIGVYDLVTTSVGPEWILPAILYLFAVVITPISAGIRSGKRGPTARPLRSAAVTLLAGGVVVGFLLLPVFSM